MGPTIATGNRHDARGFTLMELLIVITLIVVLAGIAMSSHGANLRCRVLRDRCSRRNGDEQEDPPNSGGPPDHLRQGYGGPPKL